MSSDEVGTAVSAHSADWTPEQVRMVMLYGTCDTCGAPRNEVRTPVEGGVHLEIECLNGHRPGSPGPYPEDYRWDPKA